MFIDFADNMFAYGANGWWHKMNIKYRNSRIDSHCWSINLFMLVLVFLICTHYI